MDETLDLARRLLNGSYEDFYPSDLAHHLLGLQEQYEDLAVRADERLKVIEERNENLRACGERSRALAEKVIGLEEQHQSLLTEWSDYKATTEDIIEDVEKQRDGLREQLEALRETFKAYLYAEDREALWPELHALLYDDPNPANDPLGTARANADLAAGRARPAADVFRDLGLDDAPAKERQ